MIIPVRYLPDLAVVARMVLATLIVLVVSLYYDLPYPSWALMSIALLGFKVELGNIYIKSLARIVSTAAGGIVGALITIWFGQYPLVVVILLSLVVWVCVAITSLYKAMAGYTSFLTCITCLVVVLLNLNNNSQSSICFYTLNRITEISLGSLAMLISALAIWPNSGIDRLTDSVVALRHQVARLEDMASQPEQYPYPAFVSLHTQLSRMVIDCDQQRYYTLFLDNRIGHLSGYLQRVILSVLNLMASLTMLRRLLLRQETSPHEHQAIKNAVDHRRQELDNEMEHLTHLLNQPEEIRQQEAEPGHNSLLNLQNWRSTLYGSLTAVAALVMGYWFYVITGTPEGGLMTIGGIILTGVRVMTGAPRIPLSKVLTTVLASTLIVFFTQCVLVVYANSFWPLFLLTSTPLAVLAWTLYRKLSIVGLFNVILVTVLIPVSNEQTLQPLNLVNNAFALLLGFLIGYICIEVIGTPPRDKLCKDYLKSLATVMQRTINRGAGGITPPLFRRQILPLGAAMLELFPEQQTMILNWVDTLGSIGSMCLKLQGLDSNPQACDRARALFAEVRQQLDNLLSHLHLPTTAMTAKDRECQQQMDNLFDQALTLYNRDQQTHTLNLLILCGCLRRHHELSFTDEQA
ncbi:FUSC family protein [Endozoicomonas sp. SCSIO W0465]|uniref:FUSC family protein n=1 Tax=Endozoicomonas sp. SCSIO W0465 TaxID=2918516 RepID=UPI00207661F2|nr:FUSC family protein [Endozoicomonas sp. SCSIO W0465]USE37239.1 FUSC family protein [Endozoicomonas sp. SCSIO W0465]